MPNLPVPIGGDFAATLPPDVRADLLKAQAETIQTGQRLPRVTILIGGANLYEFNDTNETTQSFQGVVLGSHARKLLWDRKYGSQRVEGEEARPACFSDDGRYGRPRPGFLHVALNGALATGEERIECRSCAYNKWGSGSMIIPDKNPKGKAVTDQKIVVVMLEGRIVPLELVLPPTSIASFDDYQMGLLNRNIPIQAVVTEFSLIRKEKGGQRYSVPVFKTVSSLDAVGFQKVLELREQWQDTITPPIDAIIEQMPTTADMPVEDSEVEDPLPF